jgi:transaldolase
MTTSATMPDVTDGALITPMQRTARTATDFWNDGPSVDEIREAIAQGAVSATSNPFLVLEVIKRDRAAWQQVARDIRASRPTMTVTELAWALYTEVARRAIEILRPVYDREGGREGYLSLQVDPTLFMDADAMLQQALGFRDLAPNIRVKFPVTAAGIEAMEEATFRGVTVTATVCFSVPQALATAEAVERGLARRRASGTDTSGMHPICAIMIGRLDDWLRVLGERDGIIAHPSHIDWAGVAVMKEAYRIYRERGYRTRILAAAYRNHLHWSEFVGGDVSLTIPYPWWKRFNASNVVVRSRIDEPVAPDILAGLLAAFPDFRRAYSVDGLTAAEFDTFGPTARTLRAFIKSYHELLALAADFTVPDPDVRRG